MVAETLEGAGVGSDHKDFESIFQHLYDLFAGQEPTDVFFQEKSWCNSCGSRPGNQRGSLGAVPSHQGNTGRLDRSCSEITDLRVHSKVSVRKPQKTTTYTADTHWRYTQYVCVYIYI